MGKKITADRVQHFAIVVGIVTFTWMFFDDMFVIGLIANMLAWLVYLQARVSKRPQRVFVRNSRSHKYKM
jgi:hypothetical protein